MTKRRSGVNQTYIVFKTTNLPQVTDKLFHSKNIMLYRVHLTWAGFELTALVVIYRHWLHNASTIRPLPRCRLIKSIPFGKYRRYSIAFGYNGKVSSVKEFSFYFKFVYFYRRLACFTRSCHFVSLNAALHFH
jgi:hypothetical protein